MVYKFITLYSSIKRQDVSKYNIRILYNTIINEIEMKI